MAGWELTETNGGQRKAQHYPVVKDLAVDLCPIPTPHWEWHLLGYLLGTATDKAKDFLVFLLYELRCVLELKKK